MALALLMDHRTPTGVCFLVRASSSPAFGVLSQGVSRAYVATSEYQVSSI